MSSKEQARTIINELIDQGGAEAILIIAGDQSELAAIAEKHGGSNADLASKVVSDDAAVSRLVSSSSDLRDAIVDRIIERAAL